MIRPALERMSQLAWSLPTSCPGEAAGGRAKRPLVASFRMQTAVWQSSSSSSSSEAARTHCRLCPAALQPSLMRGPAALLQLHLQLAACLSRVLGPNSMQLTDMQTPPAAAALQANMMLDLVAMRVAVIQVCSLHLRVLHID